MANSRAHTRAWVSVWPTLGPTPQRGSPYPQLHGPCQTVGVHIPHLRGDAKAWVSVSPTQRPTSKRGSPYTPLKGPYKSVGVRIPNSRGHAKAWDSVSHTQGATPKLRQPFTHVDFVARRHDSWRFQHPFFAPQKSISFFRPTPRVFSSWDTTTLPFVASRGVRIHPLFRAENCII